MPTPDLDRFDSRRSTLYAPNGGVATSQPLAAEAGVAILRAGGNAFDAAVATAAVLNVVEPTSTGLGGDVFALYRTADGTVEGMQSIGRAPRGATPEAIRDGVAHTEGVDPDAVTMPDRGPFTVTVPGTARGWEAILERHGTMDLATILEPAVEYARDGYPVTEVVSEQWQHGEEIFTDPNASEAFLLDGSAPAPGDCIRLPKLGRSLERLGAEGSGVVYNGELGEAIVREVREQGGLLSMDDMAQHEAEFVSPDSTDYRGVEVYELPAPNQGPIVLEALNIAEAAGLDEEPFGSPAWTHRLIEATKIAFTDGQHHITDPGFYEVPDIEVGMPEAGEDGDTVLLTVGDAEGNLVSFINSRFAGFGSGLVAGDTGIALQNRGASFSLDEADPNVIEPGKRPFHTLIPGIARFDRSDWAAFGVMGGHMQPQGHVQVLTNIVDGDLPLQAALDRPRWRYWADGTLAVEGHMPHPLPTKLARRGHQVRVDPAGEFGGAQILRLTDGVVSGASDPRKDGVAIGY